MKYLLLLPLLSACQMLGPALGQDPEGLAGLVLVDRPRMILRLPDLQRETTLLQVQERAGITLWRSGDNVQILTQAGQLYATAGLGDDLMSVERPALAAALAKGQAGQGRGCGCKGGFPRGAGSSCRPSAATSPPMAGAICNWGQAFGAKPCF